MTSQDTVTCPTELTREGGKERGEMEEERECRGGESEEEREGWRAIERERMRERERGEGRGREEEGGGKEGEEKRGRVVKSSEE